MSVGHHSGGWREGGRSLTDEQAARFDEAGAVNVGNAIGRRGLVRLKEIARGLEQRAASLEASTDTFILDDPEIGGWVAWQTGAVGRKGMLRSVRDPHLLDDELRVFAEEEQLGARYVCKAVRSPAQLVSTFFWAKPAGGSAKPWHQDMWYAPSGFDLQFQGVISLWVAIDGASRINGCLEFVPGSHRRGLIDHVGDLERTDDQPRCVSATEPQIPITTQDAHIALPLDAGAAVLLHGLVVHRSGVNRSDRSRRAMSFVYGICQ